MIDAGLPMGTPGVVLLKRSLDVRDWPIEGVAALLRAVSRRCECETGCPDSEVCVGPVDRWWLRWAEDAR